MKKLIAFVFLAPLLVLGQPTPAQGVGRIIAGTNVTVSPSSGTGGAVTINATGGGVGNAVTAASAAASAGLFWISNGADRTAVATDTIDSANFTTANVTSLRFANNTGIQDSSGNEQLYFSLVASAVNYWNMTNSATGSNPIIGALGSDSNIGLDFQAKGTGVYRLLATSSGPTDLRLFEDTDNGTNYASFVSPSSLSSNVVVTAPTSSGTIATLAFPTISVSGQSDVVADSSADTLTIAAGSNITITTNASTDTITIAASGGGGGTPGGSDTQVQFNDGGSFGGDSGLVFNKTTDRLTSLGGITITQGTANTTILSSSGGSTTGSSTVGLVDIAGTWNTSGDVTAWKMNITDTARGANSLLMDIQRDGSTRFNVNRSGTVSITGDIVTNGSTGNVFTGTGGSLFFGASRSTMNSPANGNITLYNNSQNNFSILQFGGTSSSFPGLKRNSAAIEAVLADDSARATILAAAYVGSVQALSGPGAANVTTQTTAITTTGVADAITLADGVNGQTKTILHDVDGGSFILTPTTKTGWSTYTSTNAGESITLRFVTTRGWIVIGSYLGTIAP